ncbi:MAG: dimethylmenaquinone methyltransferase [Microvirga sp.]|jgi:regulator of RNase E activity RraA|nr:dimethylmenaquinone methyltransferase [Microvirga sp.]
MAFQKYDIDFSVLNSVELDAWRAIPPAVASDCMNRTQVMSSGIKPISAGKVLCGQARTVTTMVGDCGSICTLIGSARPGEIIVVDAGGAEDVAVWGGVMAEEAVQRRLGGAVVDGAIRDVAEMRKGGLAMFCRSVVPRGPHHGFGGIIDGTISVAGVPVRPGDIVLGNDDGVVIVPLEQAAAVLKAAQAHLVKEERWLDGIRRGETIQELFSMPSSETLRPET